MKNGTSEARGQQYVTARLNYLAGGLDHPVIQLV